MVVNPTNNREDLDMRISKMISEGGLGVEAYYYNDRADDQEDKSKEEILASKMVSEGGLGAEIYYNSDEKVTNVDLAEIDDPFVN